MTAGKRVKHIVGHLIRTLTPYEVRRRRTLPAGGLGAMALALDEFDFGPEKPVAVQVGAGDGVLHDPLHRHLRSGRFRAVLLEPHPALFARLRTTYRGHDPIRCVNAALAEADGPVPLFAAHRTAARRHGDDLEVEAYQKSSFAKCHLVRHGFAAGDVEALTVRGITYRTLLDEQKLDRVDLLQIDAEGFDARAVVLALDAGLLPTVIAFEHVHIPEAERRPLFDALQRNGYRWLHDPIDTVAVRHGPPERP